MNIEIKARGTDTVLSTVEVYPAHSYVTIDGASAAFLVQELDNARNQVTLLKSALEQLENMLNLKELLVNGEFDSERYRDVEEIASELAARWREV